MKLLKVIIILILGAVGAKAQINTEQVLLVGQNALYFEDYMLSIQYFNRVITVKPYLAKPYFLRAIAKLNLEDYNGAEADASQAIELNPYLTDAWEVRGVARQNLGNNAGAIADYDHALELIPRNRQLLFNKAMAQFDSDDMDGADSTYRALLAYYPGFDSGYLGRARLNLARGDTVSASADINHALEINPNAVNGYIMRADIAINSRDDYPGALEDMDRAIKLQPRLAGLYINRAYLRYALDDYFGAMADYDYAVELAPANFTAVYNRALLLMEAGSNDRALGELDLAARLDPNEASVYYNRALVRMAKGMYTAALEDINHFMQMVPDLPDAYYIRGEIYRAMHNLDRAAADVTHARNMARSFDETASTAPQVTPEDETARAARTFANLMTIEDNAQFQEEYNNSAIRGRVQDHNLRIEPEAWMELSYYSTPTELRTSTYYIKEVEDINSTRTLRYTLHVTPAVPVIDDETSAEHFRSIDYYNSFMSTHSPRAIDYLGRAMDFMTLRDYSAALRDIDRVLAMTPDLAVGHYLRAQALYHLWQAARNGAAPEGTDAVHADAATRAATSRKGLDDVISALTRVLDLSPRMAEAWYNLAVARIAAEDYTSALAALNKAIEYKPEMGEAWYNRGFIYLKLGNERLGTDDLSRAGQLGIIPAYNLIKRITR